MKTQDKAEETLFDGAAALEVDPDILVLGAYIAEKRGLSLGELIEYLITRESVTAKQPSP